MKDVKESSGMFREGEGKVVARNLRFACLAFSAEMVFDFEVWGFEGWRGGVDGVLLSLWRSGRAVDGFSVVNTVGDSVGKLDILSCV